MTFDGIRRLSPYWSLALCYGVVTAVGLIPGLLYGNEFAYWLLGFWLILPVSALLCTFRAAYRALPRYGLMPCSSACGLLFCRLPRSARLRCKACFTGLFPRWSA